MSTIVPQITQRALNYSNCLDIISVLSAFSSVPIWMIKLWAHASHVHISISTLKSFLETLNMESPVTHTAPPFVYRRELDISYIEVAYVSQSPICFFSLGHIMSTELLKHQVISNNHHLPHYSSRFFIKTCQCYLQNTSCYLQTHPCLIFTLTTIPKSLLLDPCSRLLPGLCSFFYLQPSSQNGL